MSGHITYLISDTVADPRHERPDLRFRISDLIEFGLQAKLSVFYVGFVTLAAPRYYDGYGYRQIYGYYLIILAINFLKGISVKLA